MKRLSETKLQALDRAADYLIEAIDAGAQGAAKALHTEDQFVTEDHLKVAHASVQLAERSIITLQELVHLRQELGQ